MRNGLPLPVKNYEKEENVNIHTPPGGELNPEIGWRMRIRTFKKLLRLLYLFQISLPSSTRYEKAEEKTAFFNHYEENLSNSENGGKIRLKTLKNLKSKKNLRLLYPFRISLQNSLEKKVYFKTDPAKILIPTLHQEESSNLEIAGKIRLRIFHKTKDLCLFSISLQNTLPLLVTSTENKLSKGGRTFTIPNHLGLYPCHYEAKGPSANLKSIEPKTPVPISNFFAK